MIVVKFKGGLGNQMFQYAAGKALALKGNESLGYDPDENDIEKLEISKLNINIQPATKRSLRQFKIAGSGIWARISRSKTFMGFQYLAETSPGYDATIEKTGRNVYLDGYWQSGKYFQSIRESLLKEFTPRYDLESSASELLKSVAGNGTVAIHIRRGDYISDPSATAFHGLCDLDYYKRAVNRIKETVKKPEFFVFSDDPDWCRKNLNGEFHFVSTNGPAFTDMYIMSRCAHNIVANSSYSWWAAWLNNSREKIVIAPQKWYADPHFKNPDIYAQNWIRL